MEWFGLAQGASPKEIFSEQKIFAKLNIFLVDWFQIIVLSRFGGRLSVLQLVLDCERVDVGRHFFTCGHVYPDKD